MQPYNNSLLILIIKSQKKKNTFILNKAQLFFHFCDGLDGLKES